MKKEISTLAILVPTRTETSGCCLSRCGALICKWVGYGCSASLRNESSLRSIRFLFMEISNKRRSDIVRLIGGTRRALPPLFVIIRVPICVWTIDRGFRYDRFATIKSRATSNRLLYVATWCIISGLRGMTVLSISPQGSCWWFRFSSWERDPIPTPTTGLSCPSTELTKCRVGSDAIRFVS